MRYISRKSRIPVLVLGRGVTVLGTLRSLGRAGIPAYCISNSEDFAAYSRWARCIPNTLQDTSTPQELSAFLRSLPFERMVLMPCSDWWAQRVPRLDSDLADRFLYLGSSPGAIDRVVDKLGFAELAEAHAIPHPRTYAVDEVEDLAALPISADARYFIKARDSQAFTMLLGIKAAQVSSIEEARDLLYRARAVDQQVLLQEYVPGPATNHYFVDGFVDQSGVVRARFVRQRLRMHPWPFGNSTAMRSIAVDDVPDIVQTVDRLVAASGIRGIFSVELKRDNRDGVAKVLDVNVRPWWYVEFPTYCGMNVCEMAYRAAIGESVETRTSYRTGRTCVFPFHDFGACLRLLGQGELSLFGWARSWLGAKHTILSIRDPLPYLHFYSSVALTYLRSRRRKTRARLRAWVQSHRAASAPATSNQRIS